MTPWSWLQRERVWYVFAVVVMYLVPIMTFTIPGEDAPSGKTFLDPLAMVKAAILAFQLFGAAALLYANRSDPRFRFAALTLSGMLLYAAWSVFSTLWSPLKALTLGQSAGLLALLLHSVIVAASCCKATHTSRILRQLCYSLIAFAAFTLTFHAFNPVDSGLDRTVLHQGGDGLVHPTAAGATGSLGLLLACLSFVLFRFPWAGRALWISTVVCGLLLYLANSRAATLLAVLMIPVVFYTFASLGRRGISMLLAAGLTLGYVLWDPGFDAAQRVVGSGLRYLSRGQDMAEIRAASGRTEMWSAIWNEYLASPIIGHGYFVTSRTGKLEVWNILANHTAHNIYLQVLATTGLVGMVILALSLCGLAIRLSALRHGDLFARRFLWLIAFVSVWFFGWSLGCVSFIGPVRSESVVFFTLLGLAVGQLRRFRPCVLTRVER